MRINMENIGFVVVPEPHSLGDAVGAGSMGGPEGKGVLVKNHAVKAGVKVVCKVDFPAGTGNLVDFLSKITGLIDRTVP